MTNLRAFQGLSLIELCVCLAIASAVTAFALPAFANWIEKNKDEDAVNSLWEAMYYARTVSITKQRLIIICPWSTTSGCHSNWKDSIAVFMDQDNNLKPDEGKILRLFNSDYTGRLIARPSAKRYFRFAPTGLLSGQAGGFIFCSKSDRSQGIMKYLAINFGGRLRVENDEDGDGLIKTSSGSELTCPH
ncbi:hypothetical protein EZI54_17530 [Marinobacter halodurans]|uniref:Type II secretion system protein H n=1 Tax=Marinobacter halodurans TaxID=2528979 RepID=A0ABY1ZJ61_9GAMM|nr:GspH/FimT family pseudopilin [Marinobacter halodurans]TBW50989.1 hypothetical protein EZI54_17530 [Marinobacter halodurans]